MEFREFASKLLFSRNQAKVFHWQTTSFAKHKALDEYQEGIIDLIDDLVEAYQGEYGIIKMFKNDEKFEFGEERIIPYFEELIKCIDEYRSKLSLSDKDSNLQNTIDEIRSSLSVLLYRLKNLN